MVSDSARDTRASLVDTLEMKAARNKRNKASGDCRYDTHLHQPVAEAELGLSAPDTEALVRAVFKGGLLVQPQKG